MATLKNERIYVRVNEDIKEDFETVATYRGLNTSALLHSLIVRTIHQMKDEKPELFSNRPVKEVKTKSKKNEAELEKISAKSKKAKPGITGKTITTSDGQTLPVVDEAQSMDED